MTMTAAPRTAPTDALGAARGGGRRGPHDALVHAVPATDTTRSAVCGARVWPADAAWDPAASGCCPDCVAELAATGDRGPAPLIVLLPSAASPWTERPVALRSVS